MKKTMKTWFLLVLVLLIHASMVLGMEAIDPTTRTEWPTPNPLAAEILIENFQNWPSTRTYSSDPLKCNDNSRTTNFNWANYRIRRFSGETEYYANVYLHNVEIQPFCDTQSGVYYTLDPTNVKLPTTGNDHQGPSNVGVSRGNLMVLDTTAIGGVPYSTGYVVIGQMNRVKLIQYTTSSFGSRRGFKLEYSYDRGKTWIILRNERGQGSTDSTISTSGYQLWTSPRGIIWEENVNLSNVMLRFSKATLNSQLFRIHDLRIYGRALSSDMDDSEFELNSGINWGEWMGVARNTSSTFKMMCNNGRLQLSEPSKWVKITNLAGVQVRYEAEAQLIDVTELPAGLYLVKACNTNGQIITGKIIR
jgi:hypothetical protein